MSSNIDLNNCETIETEEMVDRQIISLPESDHVIVVGDDHSETIKLGNNDFLFDTMASEDIVFQNVGSEVSISASGEKPFAIQQVSPVSIQKSFRKSKSGNSPNKNKSSLSQGQLILPVPSNQTPGLTQFITSIKPPPLSTSGPKKSSNRATTTKKQPTIAPAPSSSSLPSSNIKMIMTSAGQQLLITSPIKQGQESQKAIPISIQSSKTLTSTPQTIQAQQASSIPQQSIHSNQQSSQPQQQIVFLSPIKSASPSTSTKLIEVRPKPSNIPSITTIQLPVDNNGSKEVKPLQIIRLVSVANNSPTSTIIDSVAGSKTTNSSKTIKTITSNAAKIQSQIGSTSLNTHKLLVPASAIKSGCNVKSINSGTNSNSVSNTPTFITTGAGGTSLIMVPAQLLQQQQQQQQPLQHQSSSITQHNDQQNSVMTSIQGKISQVSGSFSQNVKQVTFTSTKPTCSTPQRTNFIPIAPSPLTNQTSTLSASQLLAGLSGSKPTQNESKVGGDANRPRKPCNCTKSQCLKLYCDCFANGEFCNACNCINCANNLKHEEERQKAIRQCLERNPHAFHPKIGKSRGDITERRHTKGCNCRRSGCLKNYCECYEAKILCTELCKCIACKNYEDSFERKTLMHLADAAEVRSAQQSVASKSQLCGNDFRAKLPILISDKIERVHCSFITNDVIEATCDCLLAQAEYGEKNKLAQPEIEKLILEEFGRCLRQIIDTANNSKIAKANSF